MSWFSSLISGGVDKIVDSVGTAIDKVVTSDQERLELQNELIRIQKKAELDSKDIELQFEKEITTRHANDMKSSSWLSRNVRPGILVFLTAVMTVLSVTDGNLMWNDWTFVIQQSYIDMYQVLLLTAYGFYFSSRGIEKIAAIKKK